MERIKEKPTSVLVPIIDVIEAKNFYYSTNGYDTFQVSCKPKFKAKIHRNLAGIAFGFEQNQKSLENRLKN